MNGSMIGSGVYVQTNESENRVLAFVRAADGQLLEAGSYATGGAGSATPHLPSQGSVVLTGDGHLLVTNAGSNDVSVFAVADGGLELRQRIATGGSVPRSIAEHRGLVYVLDTGTASLSGFRLVQGMLEPVAGSRRALADGADPAQVGFTPDGGKLVVTERGTNALEVFAVAADGTLRDPVSVPSSGPTPYGFAFSANGTLVVTEAFGAARGQAAASSYVVANGSLAPVTRSAGNGRSEICWAVVTGDGRYAFTTNFADGAVSRYAIGMDGALVLEDAVAGLAVEGEPGLRDADLTADGRYLYAIDADSQRIFGWQVGTDGALAPVGSWNGLPLTVAGLAAS